MLSESFVVFVFSNAQIDFEEKEAGPEDRHKVARERGILREVCPVRAVVSVVPS